MLLNVLAVCCCGKRFAGRRNKQRAQRPGSFNNLFHRIRRSQRRLPTESVGFVCCTKVYDPITSRQVNEARRPHTCSRASAAFKEKQKIEKKKTRKNPPHPKNTTKSTAAQRQRPPRDGTLRNTHHALAHTCTLP